MREVFLSHSSRDQAEARRLKSLLLAHGIRVWISSHHIRGAQQWQAEIGKALNRCGWLIVVLTRHSVKSMWVKREVRYALDLKRYDGRIIPLLFQKCRVEEVSWALPQLQMIDFTRDYDRACHELLRIWEKPPRSSAVKK
jgi:hypothetical protein